MEWNAEQITKIISIFLFVVVVLFALFAIYYESKDLESEKHLDGTEFQENDSSNKIKDKIRQAAGYENTTISWRKSYIVAAISAFLILVVMKNEIPNGIELSISFLILYIVVYLTGTIYKKWLAKSSMIRVNELLNHLKC